MKKSALKLAEIEYTTLLKALIEYQVTNGLDINLTPETSKVTNTYQDLVYETFHARKRLTDLLDEDN